MLSLFLPENNCAWCRSYSKHDKRHKLKTHDSEGNVYVSTTNFCSARCANEYKSSGEKVNYKKGDFIDQMFDGKSNSGGGSHPQPSTKKTSSSSGGGETLSKIAGGLSGILAVIAGINTHSFLMGLGAFIFFTILFYVGFSILSD